MPHKFHVGEGVILRPAISRNVPAGVYEVTKQLPHDGHEFEYRIKNENEEHVRVAREGGSGAIGKRASCRDRPPLAAIGRTGREASHHRHVVCCGSF
jgi:hypothetical protein